MRPSFILWLLVLACATARAQSNDNFADRLTLSGPHPIAVSNNLHATWETGEPNHAGAAAGRSLWWTWTAPASGVVNFCTYNSAATAPVMRALAIYTGNTVSGLTEVASSNNLAQQYYLNYGYYPSYASMFTGGASVSVPVTAGTTYQVAVDALNAAAYSGGGDDGTVVLSINAPPTVLSPANVAGTTGSALSYGINASNGPTAYAATNLPSGLSINPVTGVVSGTPAAAGTSTIGLSATGPGGTGTATLTLVVSDPVPAAPVVPVITSSAAVQGLVGTAFSYSISATGSPTAFTANNLPAGLSLAASTGVISGTPTTAGITSVPLTAAGPAGTGTATLVITVADLPPPPIISSALAASGTTGSYFSYSISTSVGSATAYTASGLPPGLAFTASSGLISGTATQAGVYPVAIGATNPGGTRTATVTVTIADPVPTAAPVSQAAPPVLSSSATATGIVGTAFSYQLAASNTPTAYAASGLPPGLAFDPSSGKLTGTPTAAGTFPVAVSATNGYGASAGTLTVTVYASTAAQTAAYGVVLPVITSPAAANAAVGQSFSYGIVAAYPGSSYSPYSNGAWTFSATGLPPGLSVTGSSSSYGYGTISGSPTTAGTYAATITANGPASTSSSPFSAPHPASSGTAVVTFIIAPATAGTLPVITASADVSFTVGVSGYYTVSATGSPTSFAATGLPPGMTMSTAGAITGTPTTTGAYPATISATNAVGTASATVTCLVAASAVPVISSSAAVQATVGTSFGYTISASNSPTAYTAGNLPPGLSFSTTTGNLSGTPTAVGTYAMPVSATNASGTANTTVTITVVSGAPAAPAITSAAVAQATIGQYFYYYIQTSATVASYAASNLPPGLSLSSGSSYITGTPTTAGTYVVPISATNATGTGAATLTLTVSPPPTPVFNSSAALTLTVGQPISYYSLYATNSPTGYTFSGLPPGATASTSSPGTLTGTPTTAGVYSVGVTATNMTGTATATLTITVVPPPPPAVPVITSAAGAIGAVGLPFRYAVQASNTPTSYAIGTVPPGLSFDPVGGVLSGAPTTLGTYTFTVSATNAGGTGLGTVTLTVPPVTTASSGAPIITSPAGAVMYYNEAFYYAVTATNSPTSFTASNLPPGLSIDAASGVISGKPTQSGTSASTVVTATNAAGSCQATLYFQSQYYPSPTHLTNATTVSPVVGRAFSTTLTTNDYPYSYTATPLPGGLTLNTSTGVISGTPTTAGTTTATLMVSAQFGNGTGRLVFNVRAADAAVPDITSPNGAGGYVGVPMAYTLTGTNQPTTFAASGLPAGLTLNASTGVVSGTPTTAGVTVSTVTVGNAAGSTSAPLTFNVTAPRSELVAASGPAAMAGFVGMPLSYSLTFTPPSSTWTATCASLPSGLFYNSGTNVISGTPTSTGTFHPAVTIYDSYGYSIASAVITFVIAPSYSTLPVFTSAAGASVSVSSAFFYQLSASNSPTSYTATNLPSGLSLINGNTINGSTSSISGTYSIPLTATNATGTTNATLTLVITPPVPSAPTISSSDYLERTLYVGNSESNYIYTASGTPTAYAASGLPPGLNVSTSTGYISGTATTAGTYPVTISASNATGSASAVITYVIAPASASVTPPVFSVAASRTAYAGLPLPSASYVSASGYPTTYSASGLPPGLSMDATGTLTGTPTTVGIYSVNLYATNSAGTGTAVWTFIVKDPSVLIPVFSSPTAETTATVGQSKYYYLYSVFYDGSTVVDEPTVYTVSGLPPGLATQTAGDNTSQSSLTFSGTPTAAGTFPVTVTATGPGNNSTTAIVTFVVSNPSAPTITSTAGASGNVNSPFSYTITSGGTVISYSAGTLPDGLALNTATGIISGTPTTAGTFSVPVTVTGAGGTTAGTVTIRIDPPRFGGLPLISSAAAVSSQEFPSGTAYYFYPYYPFTTSLSLSYTITAINQPTSFSAQNLPAGLGFDPSTGIISGQPTAPGVFQVPISATNAVGTSSATLTIISTSPLPTLQGSLGYSGYVGGYGVVSLTTYFPAISAYYYSYSYPYYYPSSGSPAPLQYSATGLPPGLSINSSSGYISGTFTQAGTYPVTISVTNRAGTSRTVVTFAIAASAPANTVTPTPVAPTFYSSSAEAAGFVGLPLSYSLYASPTASYAATGLPAWLTLNPTTGAITGTPPTAGTYPVTVSATNAGGTTQAVLTVIVESAPPAPAVSSACAASANLGSSFIYGIYTSNYPGMPTATAYSAGTLPAGLTLNPVTGVISGTPTGPTGVFAVPLTASIGTAATTAWTLTLSILPAPASLPMPLLSSAAGSLAFTCNPFVYRLQSAAFAPAAALPAGLTYDPAAATISGYPTAPGTYTIPLTASWTASGGSASTPLAANLALRVTAPDLSLPRLLAAPVGGTASEGGREVFTAAAVGVPVPSYQWRHNGAIISGANDAALVLDPVQPSDTGNYTVAAINNAGSVTSATVALLVQSTYANWQADNFTTQEIAAGLAADKATPSNDAMPNLLKYALGLDPHTAVSSAALPVAYSSVNGGLQIQFERDQGKTDINYVVESSTDLQTWSSVAQSVGGAPMASAVPGAWIAETPEAGSSRFQVTVAAAPPGGGVQFLHLRIVRP